MRSSGRWASLIALLFGAGVTLLQLVALGALNQSNTPKQDDRRVPHQGAAYGR